MKRLVVVGAIAALLLALAVPAFADTLGYATPLPTDEPTTLPGGEEEPTEEETDVVVDDDEPTQARGEQLADTGIDASTLGLIAGGLLLAGGLGLLAARRAGKIE